mmetsp:Transcript_47103/g.118622  ORF Transcript_47103/g.118622 Transcript_47103/m.118622 type:complete len:292 (+) Transcript_47103:1247-2122(+)
MGSCSSCARASSSSAFAFSRSRSRSFLCSSNPLLLSAPWVLTFFSSPSSLFCVSSSCRISFSRPFSSRSRSSAAASEQVARLLSSRTCSSSSWQRCLSCSMHRSLLGSLTLVTSREVSERPRSPARVPWTRPPVLMARSFSRASSSMPSLSRACLSATSGEVPGTDICPVAKGAAAAPAAPEGSGEGDWAAAGAAPGEASGRGSCCGVCGVGGVGAGPGSCCGCCCCCCCDCGCTCCGGCCCCCCCGCCCCCCGCCCCVGCEASAPLGTTRTAKEEEDEDEGDVEREEDLL